MKGHEYVAIIDNETLKKFLSSDMFMDMFRDGLAKFISADACVEILDNGYKKIHDWTQVQDWVREGTILNHFKIGDILLANYRGSQIPFVFAAYNIAKSGIIEYKNTMTLVSFNVIEYMPFDGRELWSPSGDRQDFGNNRYAVSAIRQWLNNNRGDGKWWGRQHTWDESPGDEYEKKAGFMYGFDTDFELAINKTEITVNRPDRDGGGYDILNDEYFYLLSTEEIGLSNGNMYPVFNDKQLLRKCNASGIEIPWWLRDPVSSKSAYVQAVGSTGLLIRGYPRDSIGVVVACNII